MLGLFARKVSGIWNLEVTEVKRKRQHVISEILGLELDSVTKKTIFRQKSLDTTLPPLSP